MARLSVAVFAGILAGCCSSSPGEKESTGMVEIRGEAVNAKLSAAVLSDKGLVYCIEIPEWPENVVGRRVAVRGRLEKTDQFRARTGPSGERTAGTSGGDSLLRSVTWHVE